MVASVTRAGMTSVDAEWLTYRELAVRLGVSVEAARRRALRGKWTRVAGNDGVTRVSPPDGWTLRQPLTSAPDASPPVPDNSALVTALESHIKTLQGDNEGLKERLAAAETRIENLLADLADRGAQHADERAVLVAQIAAERANAEKAIAVFAALADRLDALAAANQRTWWNRLRPKLRVR